MSSALDLTQWVSYSTGICKFTDGGTNNIFVSNVVSGKDQISCNVTLNQGGRSASCNVTHCKSQTPSVFLDSSSCTVCPQSFGSSASIDTTGCSETSGSTTYYTCGKTKCYIPSTTELKEATINSVDVKFKFTTNCFATSSSSAANNATINGYGTTTSGGPTACTKSYTSCAAGKRLDGGSPQQCADCSAGSYSNGGTATSCTACPDADNVYLISYNVSNNNFPTVNMAPDGLIANAGTTGQPKSGCKFNYFFNNTTRYFKDTNGYYQMTDPCAHTADTTGTKANYATCTKSLAACFAGYYKGASSCDLCNNSTSTYFCPEGTAGTRQNCPAGSSGDIIGATTNAKVQGDCHKKCSLTYTAGMTGITTNAPGAQNKINNPGVDFSYESPYNGSSYPDCSFEITCNIGAGYVPSGNGTATPTCTQCGAGEYFDENASPKCQPCPLPIGWLTGTTVKGTTGIESCHIASDNKGTLKSGHCAYLPIGAFHPIRTNVRNITDSNYLCLLTVNDNDSSEKCYVGCFTNSVVFTLMNPNGTTSGGNMTNCDATASCCKCGTPVNGKKICDSVGCVTLPSGSYL